MPKQVLVVDDSLVVRDQLSLALRKAGYDVLVATDGVEALGRVRSSPDIVMTICDVNMPNMDGLEFLDSLRKEGLARFPVLMLTSEAGADRVARARALGAVAWVTKPVAPDLLVSAVDKFVR